MGAGCSCGENPTSVPKETSGTSDVTSGLKDETEEEVESRPPTPFSRPITAVILQRKIQQQNVPIQLILCFILNKKSSKFTLLVEIILLLLYFL